VSAETEAAGEAAAEEPAGKESEPEPEEKEGVFVVEDGTARFRPVRLGIAGEEHFEVISGLTEGETVVTGPFRILRDLEDGDAVKSKKSGKSGRGEDD
jgi:HlyD family secretion protein